MTEGQNLNERMQGNGEFFHLEDRASDHLFIERYGAAIPTVGIRFSVAANSFEMVLTRLRGKSFLTLRGPETAATPWIALQEASGSASASNQESSCHDFSPGASAIITMNTSASHRSSFWLNALPWRPRALTMPSPLVKRLAKSADPLSRSDRGRHIAAAPNRTILAFRTTPLSASTGVTYATFCQIERARYATILLREGVPILDVVSRLGYFDQAHLTRSLRRFHRRSARQNH